MVSARKEAVQRLVGHRVGSDHGSGLLEMIRVRNHHSEVATLKLKDARAPTAGVSF
jgi:hypothetical protein